VEDIILLSGVLDLFAAPGTYITTMVGPTAQAQTLTHTPHAV